MIFPVIYGLERTPIGDGEFLVYCPVCESQQWAEVLVSGVYSHIYYVPLFPNDKDAMVVCKRCGLKRYGVPFNQKLLGNYAEIRHLYRHRWFTYIGATIFGLPFLALIIYFIVEALS